MGINQFGEILATENKVVKPNVNQTDVYQFAYSGRGMDKTQRNAEEFALYWMHNYYRADFDRFREIYAYAYSGRGLDMTRSRAQKYALQEV